MRQLIDRRHVRRASREADHEPAAALDAESPLQRVHHTKEVEGVACELGAGSPGADLVQRAPQHLAVLPDLQLGEVKTKRLGLPDEVLDLAAGEARGAGRRER